VCHDQGCEVLFCFINSRSIFQKDQDRRGEILGLVNIASAYNRRGDLSQSARLMHEALRIATDLEDYLFMALCYGRLASYYSKDTHRPDSALMYFALTEEYNIKSGNPYFNWEMYLFRGELYYSLGMYDKGEADLLRALALTQEGSNRIDRGMVLHRLVRTFFDLKAWEKYSRYSEEYISFLSDGESGMNINNATHRVLYFFEDDAKPEQAIPVVKNIAQVHESMQHRLSAIDAWKFHDATGKDRTPQ
jgi:tetratricopeptide (TPR) repeat protein